MIQIEIQYVDSKLKKDGTVVLTAVATVINNSASNAVYGVGLSVSGPQEGASTSAQLTDANGVSVALLTLCDKTKPQTKASAEFSLLVDGMASVASVPFTVTFKMQKQDRSVAALAALPVKLFLARDTPAASLSSEAFNTAVLPTKLASAGCLSASLPLPAGKPAELASVVGAICRRVGVSVVDVFKESATFCGMVLHRKSAASDSYIALLLHCAASAADPAGADRELSLVAKCNNIAVAEALLTEVAEVVAAALA